MSENGSVHAHQNFTRNRLRHIYDQMWSTAIAKIRKGNIELDPLLQGGLPDQRRCLTVIARPPTAVRQPIMEFLRELQGLEPHQYYYKASELHITVLSLFTAVVDHAPFFAQRDRYVSAVDMIMQNVVPIRIAFKGITASPGTVMIQGFLENSALNELRDGLRRQLRDRGLGVGVDSRYRLETAHMTVTRFRAPLRNSKRFAVALDRARHRLFGAATIKNLNLVKNDWYMSHSATETIKRYRLSSTA